MLRFRPRLQELDPRVTPASLGVQDVASGDVDGDGVSDLVVGGGPGEGPRVQVWSGRTGQVVRNFFAFDPSFTGGVSVAAGDVDADGYADVLVGASTGGGPHVRAFSGRTGDVVRNFFAFEESFRGGVTLASADVTGDSRDDIIVAAGPGGGPRVRVQDGATGEWVSDRFAYDPSFRGGLDVAAAYLDRDEHADIIAGAGPGGGPHVRLISGADGSDLGGFFAYDEALRTGVTVGSVRHPFGAGDAILTGAGAGGGPHVKAFAPGGRELGSFFAGDTGLRGGVRVADLPGVDGTDLGAVAAAVGPEVGVYSLADGGWAARAAPFADALPLPPRLAALPDADGDGASDLFERTFGGSDPAAPPPPEAPRLVRGSASDVLTGTWTGTLYQESPSPHTNYTYQLALAQRGNGVTGTARIAVAGQPQYYAVMRLAGTLEEERDELGLSVTGYSLRFTETGVVEQVEPPGARWCIKTADLSFASGVLSGTWTDPDCSPGTTSLYWSAAPPAAPPAGSAEARWANVRAILADYLARSLGRPGVEGFARQMAGIAEWSYLHRDTWGGGLVLETFDYAAADIAARPGYWDRPGYDPYTAATGFRGTGNLHVAEHLAPAFRAYIESEYRRVLAGGPADRVAALASASDAIIRDHEQFLSEAVFPTLASNEAVYSATRGAAGFIVPGSARETRRQAFAAAMTELYDQGVLTPQDLRGLAPSYVYLPWLRNLLPF